MPYRLEITLKSDLFDAEGKGILQKAKNYFGIELSEVRIIHVITIDAKLSADQLTTIQTEVFTNPVIQVSSFEPLDVEFDWCIWVGYRPGVRDNPGSTAIEAIEDLLKIRFGKDESVYTSKRYCIQAENLTAKDADKIAGELLANDIVQQWKIFPGKDWDVSKGVGFIIPKVKLDRTPTVKTISVDSDSALEKVSYERNLALNPN
ncbi:MAG: phosphoribosylformylglycinamidine synthase subunit PurS, partial [Deltaproteobacteria bacterium]|nr:phosphoribosylformylglycinamidine synthase subunit PurS [Deltaproteobacteria bacterium]